MPPQVLSRHIFTDGLTVGVTVSEKLVLSLRTPFTFRKLADTRTHLVKEGQTLFSLAGRYFAPTPRASGLWWVIADFQPEPIFDPTVPPLPGTFLYIPSLRAVLEKALSEERRSEVLL